MGRKLVPVVLDRLPTVLEEVARQLSDRHPGYAGFVTDEFPHVLGGAENFVGQLMTTAVEDREPRRFVSDAERELFAAIGRAHLHEDQDIDGLLAAYRIGGSVLWRHIADAALRSGLATSDFAGLATAVFAAVDELSSASLQGYLDAESARRHTVERARQDLTELLLTPRSDPAAIRAAANRAGWSVPGEAAVVVMPPDDHGFRHTFDDGCLVSRDGTAVVVPDPTVPGRRNHLARVLAGRAAVVGPTTAVHRLRESLELARLAVRLHRDGVLNGSPLFVDEHLDTVIVHRDEHLLDAMRRHALGPVQDLPASTGDRLVETLTSWLLHMGNCRAVATDLRVHPQTVRYRLGRLRGLLDLDAPRVRAALFLGLVWPGPDHAGGDGAPRAPAPAVGVRVRDGRQRRG